jgi:protein TonB
LRIDAVRNAVSDVAPVFVSFITPEQLSVEAPPPPLPQIVPKKEPPRLITTAAPATSSAEFVAPPAPAEPVAVVPEVVAPPSPPAPTVAAPAPKLVTAVEYIRPPQVEYPAVSRRLNEQGRVLLRVLINRAGHAERVEVQKSSGSRRLDEAAMKAAREALYRPYSENGEAIPVWALVPTLFELS